MVKYVDFVKSFLERSWKDNYCIMLNEFYDLEIFIKSFESTYPDVVWCLFCLFMNAFQ